MRALTMDELIFVSGGQAPTEYVVVTGQQARALGATDPQTIGDILGRTGGGRGDRLSRGGVQSENAPGCNGAQLLYDWGQAFDRALTTDLDGDGDVNDERDWFAATTIQVLGSATVGGPVGVGLVAGAIYQSIQTALDRGYINTVGC